MSNTQEVDGQPPAAWVWSQYRAESPAEPVSVGIAEETPQAPPAEAAPDAPAPAPASGAARDSSAIGLGLAAAVLVIAGLTWLFTSKPASAPAESTLPAATEAPAQQKSEAAPPAVEPVAAPAPAAPAAEPAKPAPPAAPAHGKGHGKQRHR
ncbi:MAG: hypothetical protein CTY15_01010 [Methylocystis sp.]|nr:MAG: hypothetical protein CTY15_01010 [Methylocystis sp.]